MSAVNADGVLNPYPVITLRAKDEKTGKLLAESAAVLAVSPGFGCAQCHANAGRPFWKCTTATSPPTLWNSTRKVRSLPADPAMSA